jgi:hypothetical protein
MTDLERIESIREQLARDQYFEKSDVEFLLHLLEKRDKKIEVLSTQTMELMQEIENVKSDFGGLTR